MENPTDDDDSPRQLFLSSRYYLVVPHLGPLVDPDKLSSDQMETAKTLRGKIIKKTLKIIEAVERILEP